MDDHDIPINVILLQSFDSDIESLVDGYYDLLKSCKSKQEKQSAIKMMVEESMELNTKVIFTRLIQHLAELQDKK